MQRTARVLGGVCLTLALLFLAPALPLHCGARALIIGGASLIDGSLMGLLMAAITRTRRPTLIYLCLLLVALTLWPLFHYWPPIYIWDVETTHGIDERVENYLEAVRPALFLLGVPYPFARWGQHGPDPQPTAEADASPEEEASSEEDPITLS